MACKSILIFHLVYILSRHEGVAGHSGPKNPKATVILLSFDGFRWDYMEKTATPNLDFIAKTGVRAKYVKSIFPTQTFPNHFTIVTGLYAESHGIVANTMYDPELKSWFFMNNTETKWWDGGEPVWVTNQHQGGTSAVVFWPGSETVIRGVQPTYFMKYDERVTYQSRVDRLMKALDIRKPATFLAAYFEEPDHSGHMYGPESEEVVIAIRKVDTITGYLVKQLQKRHLLEKVNIIITSDHGMSSISSKKLVFLEDYIPPQSYKWINVLQWGAFAQILPMKGWSNQILLVLKDVDHLNVYKKSSIPKQYHYTKNRRIAPIIIIADEGWSVVKNRTVDFKGMGNHGYSNKYQSMGAFFVARGPYFKRNYISKPLNNVDIYPLVCDILQIKAAPNNGSLHRIKSLLHLNEDSGTTSNYTVLVLLVIVSFLVFVIMGCGIVSLCRLYNMFNHIP
ncbi:predicted protein [Nematostella vectensis]|uniref:Bis(5'-adenosyl)-triphosphatase n=1 Tax=Nematostella vectensis TaxID=45351 RepID=A7RI34_NEMVE|nr:predicted protein [Nematostella vectensis]|eukprot:XP_001641023.1 predicted protein [Nematostella vectensis]